jgi:ribosomal protein L21E
MVNRSNIKKQLKNKKKNSGIILNKDKLWTGKFKNGKWVPIKIKPSTPKKFIPSKIKNIKRFRKLLKK